MKIGDKIVCINAKKQVNNFDLINKVKKGKIYTIRKFTSYDGIILKEFINGYHQDGEEGGFNPKRFVLLKQMGFSQLIK